MISMALSADGGTPRRGLRDWVLDGAATCGHVSTRKEHFQNLKMYETHHRPTIGGLGGDRVEVQGKGSVILKLATGRCVTLHDVSYAPGAVANLFAVRSALSKLGKGAEHRETTRSSKITDANGKVVLTSSLRQGLLYVDLASDQDFC